MNRLVRIRMLGGVGAEGENPSATRFRCLNMILSRVFYCTNTYLRIAIAETLDVQNQGFEQPECTDFHLTILPTLQ